LQPNLHLRRRPIDELAYTENAIVFQASNVRKQGRSFFPSGEKRHAVDQFF
jgi:hypothetical protein